MNPNRLVLYLVLPAALGVMPTMTRATDVRAIPVDPVVTREEAGWIQSAVDMASTNLPAALAVLETRRSPQASAAIDFTAGNLAFQAGDLKAAISAYQAAIGKMPSFRRARVNLARIHLRGDRPGEAMDVLRGVTTDGLGDADTYLLLGHALLMTDAPVSAETAYRQSLMLRPGDSDARLGLARALLPQNRPAETGALARELLRHDPHRREVWGLLAHALLALDRSDDAVAALESARRLGAADAGMLATLGDLHLNAGRPDDAVRCYEAAFEGEAPSVARLLRSIDGLLLMREAASAARMRSRLQALLDRGGVDPTREERQILRRQEADLLLLLDRPDEALATYAELLREDPTNGGVLLRSAELHRAAGRLEDAAIFCERAARVPPSQVDALVLHAQVETQRARYSRAVDLLAAAQALRPTDRVQRYLDQIRRLQALDEAAAAGVQ